MADPTPAPTLASAISALNDTVVSMAQMMQADQNRRTERDAKKEEGEKDKKKDAETKKLNGELKSSVRQLGTSVTTMITTVKRLSDSVAALSDTQRRLGISLTTALDVRVGALAQSSRSQILAVRGLVDAIKGVKSSFGPPVRPQDILDAQQAYAEEFGAIISSAAGTGLAQEASRMGVTADKIVKSTRVFLGASLNDYNKALSMQSRFMSAFRGQGLAPRAAYEAIIKYSDLIAKNGDRFAQGFARAAADAKKIGTDLNKIEQFADSMVDDFSGFLEKQGELAAMGFQFDSSRLLEAAASDDTERITNELRSQLANTGKDLENLNRFERRMIENAFGINIGELKRLAGATPAISGSGGDTMENTQSLVSDIKKLLESSNNPIVRALKDILDKYSVFDRIENLIKDPDRLRAVAFGMVGTGGILGVITSGLLLLGSVLKPVISLFSALGRGLTSVLKLFGVGTGGAAAGGTGLLQSIMGIVKYVKIAQGLVGGILGFTTAKREGASTSTALGAGVIRGGAGMIGGSILGGALGSFLGPIGTLIGTLLGGFIGDIFGKTLNKYVPQLSKLLGSAFLGGLEGLKSGWNDIKNLFVSLNEDALKPMAKQVESLFTSILKMIGGTEEEGMRKLTKIFKTIGFVIGSGLLYPLEVLLASVKVIVNIVRLVAAAVQGNWTEAYAAASDIGTDIFNTLTSPFRRAAAFIGEMQVEDRARENVTGSVGFARGGLITGPGTSTSDSVFARLSAGEYVLNAKATKALGTDVLNQLNSGILPKYATGGEVSRTPSRTLSPSQQQELNNLTTSRTTLIREYGQAHYNLYYASIFEPRIAELQRKVQIPIVQNVSVGAQTSGQNAAVQGLSSARSTTSDINKGVKVVDETLIPLLTRGKGLRTPGAAASSISTGAQVTKQLESTFVGGFQGKNWRAASEGFESSLWKGTGKFLKNFGSVLQGVYLTAAILDGDYRGAARAITQTVAGKVAGTLVGGAVGAGTYGTLAPLAFVATDIAVSELTGKLFDEIFPTSEAAEARRIGQLEMRKRSMTAGFTSESVGMGMQSQQRPIRPFTEVPLRRMPVERMHEGGIVGATGPNEVPAILERGEMVLSAAQTEAARRTAMTAPTVSSPTVNVDISQLEAKLDMVVRAISSMEVKVDGVRVGSVIARGADSGYQVGALRQNVQRLG